MAHVRDSRTVIIVLTPESIKFVDSNQAITEYGKNMIEVKLIKCKS